jgi:transcriptional antiterminator Rof (Rho-off)
MERIYPHRESHPFAERTIKKANRSLWRIADRTNKEVPNAAAICHLPSALVSTMTDAKYHIPEPGSLVGRVFKPATNLELSDAIELAFDYRGDVTLELASGEQVTGYLFNRSVTQGGAAVELFVLGSDTAKLVPYTEIRSIAFSGEDTADGKSWEAWVAKKESERQTEADQVEADAKARGHL